MESKEVMTVTINIEEYRELLDLQSRVDVFQTMMKHDRFFRIPDACAVLGIEYTGEDD